MKKEHAQFRLRGFHCDHCGDENQVFGNDPAPFLCLGCSGSLQGSLPKYDELVTTVKTVEPGRSDKS